MGHESFNPILRRPHGCMCQERPCAVVLCILPDHRVPDPRVELCFSVELLDFDGLIGGDPTLVNFLVERLRLMLHLLVGSELPENDAQETL
jgi:hypothetical protein